MKDLSLLVYTNQTYQPIAELCLEQINNHFKKVNFKKYITSNCFSNDFKELINDFDVIDTSVPFSESGYHFSEVLIKSLERISSEYILFFLDDYLVINDVKLDVLENLINVMKDENIDYVSLMSYDYSNWKSLNINYQKYSLPEDILIHFDYSYYYMFSVQPCIWKKNSLITILEHNKKINVHDFDTTNIKNKKGEIRYYNDYSFWNTSDDFWDYNFKFVTLRKSEITKNFAFDERNSGGDYFLFLYSEVIRNGKFNFNTHHNNRIFLEKYLKDKNIFSNSEKYKLFF